MSVRRKNKIRISLGDRVFLAIVYLFLGLFVLTVVYPLIYVISCSFSNPEALVSGQVFFFPVDPGLQGYQAVLNNTKVWRAYGNTILYTVVGTVIGTSVTMMGAYVLSRKEFPLNGFLTAFFMFTMFFGGGTIPTYLIMKDLHLIDKIWALVLPGAFSVWLAIVGRTFIKSSIPEEMFEAASLDGCDYIRYFFKIILPLAKPILAVLALNFALGQWNSYYGAMLYLNDSYKYPLQIVLREILIQNTVDITNNTTGVDVNATMQNQYLSELLKYSLIVISSIPLLCIYPFIQKYFIKGVMVGSVKG